MAFLLILKYLMVMPPLQIAAKLNCMRTNRGALDGSFNLFNKHENIENVTKEDVAKQMSLFSTRFNRAHVFNGIYTDIMKTIAEGVLQYEKESNVTKQLFLSTHHGPKGNNFSDTVSLWKDAYQTVTAIRASSKDLVVGLYLKVTLPTWSSMLEAIHAVFGRSKNSHFRRLQFVTCRLIPDLKSSPEHAAEDMIRKCKTLMDIARLKNIGAEIMCALEYYSEFNSTNGIVGSVSGFHRFWCQVLNHVTRNQSEARIIMQTAFDYTPILLGRLETSAELRKAHYHTGWWRRTHRTSYEQSSFVEKVEESLNLSSSLRCTKTLTLFKLVVAFCVV